MNVVIPTWKRATRDFIWHWNSIDDFHLLITPEVLESFNWNLEYCYSFVFICLFLSLRPYNWKTVKYLKIPTLTSFVQLDNLRLILTFVCSNYRSNQNIVFYSIFSIFLVKSKVPKQEVQNLTYTCRKKLLLDCCIIVSIFLSI